MPSDLYLFILYKREAELKHCRLAMLAVLGYVATDLGLRFPGRLHLCMLHFFKLISVIGSTCGGKRLKSLRAMVISSYRDHDY